MRLALGALALALLSTTASAAPLLSQFNPASTASNLTEAKVICDKAGYCYSPPGRHPTARWIYGNDAFYGPYDGPHYYGAPNLRYKWSFLNPFWTW